MTITRIPAPGSAGAWPPAALEELERRGHTITDPQWTERSAR